MAKENTELKPALNLAESIARRNAANSTGLEAVEWFIAAVLIGQYAANHLDPCQVEKKTRKAKVAVR